MTFAQLEEVARWHMSHRARRPIEARAWEAVLTFWMAGCAGAPSALILHSAAACALCVALVSLPGAYVGLRARLHAARRVRCEWIGALAKPSLSAFP